MFAEHGRRQQLIRWGFWEQNAKWTLPYHNVGDVIMSDTYRSLFRLTDQNFLLIRTWFRIRVTRNIV